MSDDNFLKKHRKRPDPEFVETLFQDINQPRRNKLTHFLRNSPRWRLALVGVSIIVILFALSFIFSPSVRAACTKLFSLNGIEFGADEALGGLSVVSDWSDAIIKQKDEIIVFKTESVMPSSLPSLIGNKIKITSKVLPEIKIPPFFKRSEVSKLKTQLDKSFGTPRKRSV
ncbi:MAG: hypothetical protein AAF490_00830 [Chloroflexota bacterium]